MEVVVLCPEKITQESNNRIAQLKACTKFDILRIPEWGAMQWDGESISSRYKSKERMKVVIHSTHIEVIDIWSVR